ncbi:MAG: LysR family transcriptional regulator [Actinobacteria bacterium HGW-Actinobacteria-1]|jgi:enamine deaminase RidA (YjgF/YER057c/UK114 family)|nr:MAG: LysR family transcriptional regulator [Actinobacteria bacterium HGW-Actinobacteria-1]
MAAFADRLAELGLELPSVAVALGSYVPAVRSGSLVFTSGQLPMQEGELLARGKVGAAVSDEIAVACARRCALNALSAASSVCSLDDIVRVVRVTGYVASDPTFTAQPAVVNGASDLLVDIFGDRGRHSREAVGVAALPLDAPVEVSIVLEVAAT